MESIRPATVEDLPYCLELIAAATTGVQHLRGGPRLHDLGDTGESGEPGNLTVSVGGAEPTRDAVTMDLRADAEPDALPSDLDRLAAWASDAHRCLLVGLFEGIPVGIAAGTIRTLPVDAYGPAQPDGSSSRRATRLGRLDGCFVEPAARGVGVGTALVRAVLDWFSARGCSEVDATALPGDRSTKQLLEAAGFKTRLLILHRLSD